MLEARTADQHPRITPLPLPNPFRGLANPREVWAWGMYDLANQSFTLLITTLFFGIYFQQHIVANDPARGLVLWGQSFAIASLIVIAVSPVMGALADFSGRKKLFLTWLGVSCAVLTMALGLVRPGQVGLAMTLYIAANVCFMSGENFLAAFLPEIAPRGALGRVSAIGWTMGYIGALICLPLSLLIPGVVAQTVSGFRLVCVFAGLWFLLAALPTLLFLKERKQPERLPPGQTIATVGFARLVDTARNVGRFRQLALFLCFFLIYACGMQVFIVFSGILASGYLSQKGLVGFVWLLAAVAGVGSFATGAFQDRLGHKRTIALSLLIWLATALGAAALPNANASMIHFALVGIGVGTGLGMAGTASRALVGAFTPAQKTAEFFGLWGLGYKIAGALGPPLYAWITAAAGQQAGMLAVAATFAVGLVGVLFVNTPEGERAAGESEREFAARSGLQHQSECL